MCSTDWRKNTGHWSSAQHDRSISAEAEADLEAIAGFIAADNPTRALSFIVQLGERCVELSEMPAAFPLVPRYERFGIRRRVYGNYLIFYRIGQERITVIHILHGATDYARVLFPK